MERIQQMQARGLTEMTYDDLAVWGRRPMKTTRL